RRLCAKQGPAPPDRSRLARKSGAETLALAFVAHVFDGLAAVVLGTDPPALVRRVVPRICGIDGERERESPRIHVHRREEHREPFVAAYDRLQPGAPAI